MVKVFMYMLRISITPIMIVLIILPVYLLGLINSQSTYIALLLFSGILGQVIQYYVQEWHKKRSGIKKEPKEIQEKVESEQLSKLPKEVQDLIREGESLKEEGKESDHIA